MQELACLAKISSLSLRVFSFIVQEKIKILLTAFFWVEPKETNGSVFLCDSAARCARGLSKFP